MEKITLNDELKNEILSKYNDGVSIRKLEKEYKYSFSFIRNLILCDEFKKSIQKLYPQKEGYHIVAVCKITNKEFIDYRNDSGAISKHIFSTYKIKMTSKFKRKEIEFSSGNFWYYKYFNFVYKENEKKLKCDYCDWTTNDINNRSGAYEKHLLNVHNISLNEHLKLNKDQSNYFKHIEEPIDGITCKICGKKLKMINNSHMKMHNISLYEYKLKYSENTISKNTFNNKLKNSSKIGDNIIKYDNSKIENEIKDFLILNGIEILKIKDCLDNIEIELYSPKDRIGIELSSNNSENTTYDLNKTKIALDKNIKLYHIQRDEWVFSQEIVKAKLSHIFNKNKGEKIYARNCTIKEINEKEKSDFLNKNHIQGNDKSKIYLGAFYNEELCGVMSFTNTRNMNNVKKEHVEFFDLSRFASSNKYIAIGIAGKLLKYFIKNYNPIKIISFADRRWTPNINDNLYTKLGFNCVEILPPDYSYYKKTEFISKRLHKFGFCKSVLKTRFPEIYDENKTEWEMMQELGYDRIWDCGKLKYELILKK